MSFSIKLYKNNSEKKKVSKNLTIIDEISGNLKEECGKIEPVFFIEAGDIDANYCYVEEFHRYYFINDVSIVRANLLRLKMEADDLMNLKNDIWNSKAIVERTESHKYYNKNFDDSEWNRMVEARCTNQILNFPEKFVKNFSEGKYVLVTVGVGGTVVNP